MTKRYFLVGEQGSGKTTLAVALAAFHSRRPGVRCVQLVEGFVHVYQPAQGDFAWTEDQVQAQREADFEFIELLPGQMKDSMVQAGDVVIRVDRVDDLRLGEYLVGRLPLQGVAHA